MSESILAKGIYSHLQINGFISAKQYMFLSKEGKKYVAVRFSNDADFAVTAMSVDIFQLDGSGKILRRDRVEERSMRVFRGRTFTLKTHPELDEKCSDIKVQINYVDSGDYRYTPIKDRVKVNYRLSGKTAESGADIYTRQRSHEPSKRLFSFLVGVILTLLIVINLVQIALPFLKDNLGNKRSSGGKEISISRSYDETEETE